MQQFVEEHKKVYPGDDHPLDMSGLPDQGYGWYSKKWDPDTWLEYNQVNRAHMNYLENLPYMIFLPPIAGVFFPVPALTGVYCLWFGRMMYTAGYVGGVQGARGSGFLIQFCNILMLLICSIWTAVKVMEYGADLYEMEEKALLDPIKNLINDNDRR